MSGAEGARSTERSGAQRGSRSGSGRNRGGGGSGGANRRGGKQNRPVTSKRSRSQNNHLDAEQLGAERDTQDGFCDLWEGGAAPTKKNGQPKKPGGRQPKQGGSSSKQKAFFSGCRCKRCTSEVFSADCCVSLIVTRRGCHFFSDARFSVSQTPKSVAEALLALVFECCAADSAKYDEQESGDPHTQLEASRLSRRLSQGHFKPRRLSRKERRRLEKQPVMRIRTHSGSCILGVQRDWTDSRERRLRVVEISSPDHVSLRPHSPWLPESPGSSGEVAQLPRSLRLLKVCKGTFGKTRMEICLHFASAEAAQLAALYLGRLTDKRGARYYSVLLGVRLGDVEASLMEDYAVPAFDPDSPPIVPGVSCISLQMPDYLRGLAVHALQAAGPGLAATDALFVPDKSLSAEEGLAAQPSPHVKFELAPNTAGYVDFAEDISPLMTCLRETCEELFCNLVSVEDLDNPLYQDNRLRCSHCGAPGVGLDAVECILKAHHERSNANSLAFVDVNDIMRELAKRDQLAAVKRTLHRRKTLRAWFESFGEVQHLIGKNHEPEMLWRPGQLLDAAPAPEHGCPNLCKRATFEPGELFSDSLIWTRVSRTASEVRELPGRTLDDIARFAANFCSTGKDYELVCFGKLRQIEKLFFDYKRFVAAARQSKQPLFKFIGAKTKNNPRYLLLHKVKDILHLPFPGHTGALTESFEASKAALNRIQVMIQRMQRVNADINRVEEGQQRRQAQDIRIDIGFDPETADLNAWKRHLVPILRRLRNNVATNEAFSIAPKDAPAVSVFRSLWDFRDIPGFRDIEEQVTDALLPIHSHTRFRGVAGILPRPMVFPNPLYRHAVRLGVLTKSYEDVAVGTAAYDEPTCRWVRFDNVSDLFVGGAHHAVLSPALRGAYGEAARVAWEKVGSNIGLEPAPRGENDKRRLRRKSGYFTCVSCFRYKKLEVGSKPFQICSRCSASVWRKSHGWVERETSRLRIELDSIRSQVQLVREVVALRVELDSIRKEMELAQEVVALRIELDSIRKETLSFLGQ